MAELRTKKLSLSLVLEEIDDHYNSDSDDEFLNFLPALVHTTAEREAGNRIRNYFEIVIPKYSDVVFKSHFRIHRESCELLAKKLGTSFHLIQQQSGGRPMVDLRKQICVFLWFSASEEPYRSVADRFNVTESTVLNIITRVTNAILSEMKDEITWPTGSRLKETFDGFKTMKGLENGPLW